MSLQMFRLIAMGALLLGSMVLGACNTMHGFGEDIEAGGQKIQEVSGQKAQEW